MNESHYYCEPFYVALKASQLLLSADVHFICFIYFSLFREHIINFLSLWNYIGELLQHGFLGNAFILCFISSDVCIQMKSYEICTCDCVRLLTWAILVYGNNLTVLSLLSALALISAHPCFFSIVLQIVTNKRPAVSKK